MEKKELGIWGEEKAAAFLRRRGYRIVEQNYSCRFGEIDIIARKGEMICFVEVKTRKNRDFAEAREFVTASKQRRIISTAQLWMLERNVELQPRFDVMEVYAPNGASLLHLQINHIEDAFR